MDYWIQAFFFILLAILAGLIALLMGLIGRVILTWMKEMLHLEIKIEPGKKDEPTSP